MHQPTTATSTCPSFEAPQALTFAEESDTKAAKVRTENQHTPVTIYGALARAKEVRELVLPSSPSGVRRLVETELWVSTVTTSGDVQARVTIRVTSTTEQEEERPGLRRRRG